MIAASLLAALFLLTIGHLVTLKLCSDTLDHRTAPIFISVWTLAGVVAAYPVFGHLWAEGLDKFIAHPPYLFLAALKGGLMYLLFVISQRLMKESLSSRHYVTPMAVGLIAIANSFLGEVLTPQQWASALGLGVLSAAFFFKGHLSTLSRKGKIGYAQLVLISVALSAIDHAVTKEVNWYALLAASNVVLGFLVLLLHCRDRALLRAALLTPAAGFAGAMYAATELVKFYQMVTINPVSLIVLTQAMTKPVILTLSALVWKERSLREQLLWGAAAAILVVLPYFF